MTPITAWLALTALNATALLPARRALNVAGFVAATALSFYVAHAPLGQPVIGEPAAGQYQVHGARIDDGKAIFVLLSRDGDEPRYYRLGYAEASANDLQAALDAQFGGNGGGISAEIGESGDAAFHAAPVTGEIEKVPEAAIIQEAN